MEVGKEGTGLVKYFEFFEDMPYTCPAGKKTIGWGHVILPEDDFDLPLSPEDGLHLLVQDLGIAKKAVQEGVVVGLHQYQFDALVSLAFNIGNGAFLKSQTLEALNRKNLPDLFKEWKEWRKADGEIISGLEKRRACEIVLFQNGDWRKVFHMQEEEWRKVYESL